MTVPPVLLLVLWWGSDQRPPSILHINLIPLPPTYPYSIQVFFYDAWAERLDPLLQRGMLLSISGPPQLVRQHPGPVSAHARTRVHAHATR